MLMSIFRDMGPFLESIIAAVSRKLDKVRISAFSVTVYKYNLSLFVRSFLRLCFMFLKSPGYISCNVHDV